MEEVKCSEVSQEVENHWKACPLSQGPGGGVQGEGQGVGVNTWVAQGRPPFEFSWQEKVYLSKQPISF